MPIEKLTPRFLPKVWGGEIWFEAPIPVLVKFILTFDKLSVQVHPGDRYARRHHNSAGKTEMWYILEAQPGARIAAGFKQNLSRARMRQAALSGEIEDLLEWHAAKSGDTFFIPAGTVHAIGGGLVLCEIQQYSDITYRLYDYGRLRELHLDHAVAVSQRTPHPARRKPRGNELVSCDYFTTVRRNIKGRSRLDPAFRLAIITAGVGTIAGNGTSAGEVWYAPPGAGPITVEGKLTVLAVKPGLNLKSA
jgi:mannose-6-phosphate isomerase